MSRYLEDQVQLARDWDDARPRSRQAQPGWSDMAGCRAWMGYRVRGDWPTDDTDNWRAIAGTALHAWWTHVRRGQCLRDGTPASFGVPVVYRGVPGTLDEVEWPTEDGGRWAVCDWKFPRLASIRLWADDGFLSDLFTQPHGYAAGVAELGMSSQHSAMWAPYRLDPDACVVRLLGMPVDGTFGDWQAHEAPFSREAADMAVDRYQDVQAAVAAGETLPRDKPEWFCSRWCEYVSACRGWDREPPRDLEVITDPELAAAVEQYGMAGEMAAAAEKIQKELRPLLEGARGKARGFRIWRGRPAAGKLGLDEAAVELALGERGIPVSEVMRRRPTGKPKLYVARDN